MNNVFARVFVNDTGPIMIVQMIIGVILLMVYVAVMKDLLILLI